MWFEKSVFYHIYPLGFCGAPIKNDGFLQNRISKIADWIPHLKDLGITGLYLGPVFESDCHGYDTRDYRQIDCRLGSQEVFRTLCQDLHSANIKIILDGVFNHVGRGFWAFQDVLSKRDASAYLHWFMIDLNRDNEYQDGLWYEGWEGHNELVQLNLKNQEVIHYLFSCIEDWITSYSIDGLRLDVAYSLDQDFLKQLRTFTNAKKQDFFLLGEMIHGDYNQLVTPDRLNSCTNYECYKGLYSSFNDKNLFEIAYSLNRQFGDHGLYRNHPLAIFADNHDVNRIASTIQNPHHLPLLYGLLLTMPGIPFLYYGSEWGAEGIKTDGNDQPLRACYPAPIQNHLSHWISQLVYLHQNHSALIYGSYHQVYLTNEQFVFKRKTAENCLLIAINLSEQECPITLALEHPQALDLITKQRTPLSHQINIAPFSFHIWQL